MINKMINRTTVDNKNKDNYLNNMFADTSEKMGLRRL